MMTVTLTCPECGSGIHVYPSLEAKKAGCTVCHHEVDVHFNEDHINSIMKDCPSCQRKDFYTQKDFNRKIGVILFVIAAILSIWTYGLSLVALWLVDLFLFKRLPPIVICYKCSAIFRGTKNYAEIHGFDHEMHDRIVYKDHDFEGRPPSH
jgi:uncharacterized C2H2 Zn-finger protein